MSFSTADPARVGVDGVGLFAPMARAIALLIDLVVAGTVTAKLVLATALLVLALAFLANLGDVVNLHVHRAVVAVLVRWGCRRWCGPFMRRKSKRLHNSSQRRVVTLIGRRIEV